MGTARMQHRQWRRISSREERWVRTMHVRANEWFAIACILLVALIWLGGNLFRHARASFVTSGFLTTMHPRHRPGTDERKCRSSLDNDAKQCAMAMWLVQAVFTKNLADSV